MTGIAVLIVNFILYLAFGSFFTVRKGKGWSLPVTVGVGFFAYYSLFAIVCLPVMFTYRPLSFLCRLWIVPCIVITAVSFVLYGRKWIEKITCAGRDVAENRTFWAVVFAITLITVILAVITYNFTLDAAYYVANVATNVDTDMINVYDAFTGEWQDHFELRYVFATYYANDAVICKLTHLPALVQTKTVMSATVMIIVNILYVKVCRFFHEDRRQALLMYVLMTAVNFLFISIYTASHFLMTRTYEGKTIVGNISLILIFILYMLLVKEGNEGRQMLLLFIVCLGTATVSSTANMVIPAAVCVLFVPYAFLHKRPSMLAKIFLCILPELTMMLIYVLYVKGYFAVYTYPR